jgi:hypothetical protein
MRAHISKAVEYPQYEGYSILRSYWALLQQSCDPKFHRRLLRQVGCEEVSSPSLIRLQSNRVWHRTTANNPANCQHWGANGAYQPSHKPGAVLAIISDATKLVLDGTAN